MYTRTAAQTFTVFPAINLRKGQVVGPRRDDSTKQTVYETRPAAAARRWINAGARWLHVTDLDAAAGIDNPHTREALTQVLKIAKTNGVKTQISGGLDSLESIARVLNMGYNRAVLGPAVVRQPFVLAAALDRWGPERIAICLDAGSEFGEPARDARRSPVALARWFAQMGLRWLVLKPEDPQQAGGLNSLAFLSDTPALNVIAAYDAERLEDILEACRSGLAGIVVNRPLYEGRIDPARLFAEIDDELG